MKQVMNIEDGNFNNSDEGKLEKKSVITEKYNHIFSEKQDKYNDAKYQKNLFLYNYNKKILKKDNTKNLFTQKIYYDQDTVNQSNDFDWISVVLFLLFLEIIYLLFKFFKRKKKRANQNKKEN